MTLVPITCYRCLDCNRIYEEKPSRCVCERQVYIEGERFGSFVVVGKGEGNTINARCLLCSCRTHVLSSNIRRQQSCGCKPKHAEIIELNESTLVYRCRKCMRMHTVNLPIITYCCED